MAATTSRLTKATMDVPAATQQLKYTHLQKKRFNFKSPPNLFFSQWSTESTTSFLKTQVRDALFFSEVLKTLIRKKKNFTYNYQLTAHRVRPSA